MTTNDSNLRFMKPIIDSEVEPELKSKLKEIYEVMIDAERDAGIEKDTNYRGCILLCGVACDCISHFIIKKKFPDKWDELNIDEEGKDRDPSMQKIWTRGYYAREWDNEKDLQLYVDLFHLKGEYNCAHHNGKRKYKIPWKRYSEEKGREELCIHNKYDNVIMSKDDIQPSEDDYKKMLQHDNALNRFRLTYDFLCSALDKCGYSEYIDTSSYFVPTQLTAVKSKGIETINKKLDDTSEILKSIKAANDYQERVSKELFEGTIEKVIDTFSDKLLQSSSQPKKELPNDDKRFTTYVENPESQKSNQKKETTSDSGENDKTVILKKIIATASIILLVLVGLIAVNKMRSPNAGITTSKGASVYYSKIIPYTEAGKYESYASSSDVSDYLETDKAVALLAFIKNEAPDAAVVEDITCKFEEIEEIAEPNLKTDAALVDNVLKIYVVNDGNGDSSEVAIDISGDGLELSDYASENKKNTIEGLQSGEIVEIAEYKLLSEEFHKQNVEEINIVIKLGDNISEVITILYDPVEDAFVLANGTGDSGADITLFSVLDVDSKPESISFNPEKITTIEDALRIETVLAPTKTCKIRFKGSYTVDGNTEETASYTATVTVPIYRDGAFGHGGELTNELANDANNSKAHVKQVAQKYLYDPETLNSKNDE